MGGARRARRELPPQEESDSGRVTRVLDEAVHVSMR